MKIKATGIITLLACAAMLGGCKKEESINLFPDGTASLNMMNEKNGKTLLGNSDVYLTEAGNFKSLSFQISDMGPKRGIGDIEVPDFKNMAREVAAEPGHGYMIYRTFDILDFGRNKNAISQRAQVYRVFVDSWIKDENGEVTGARVRFLQGRPDEKSILPEYGSTAGKLTWDYDAGCSNTLSIALSSSDPEDTDIGVFTDNVNVSYSISENKVHFKLIWPAGPNEYLIQLRHKNIFTEFEIEVEY